MQTKVASTSFLSNTEPTGTNNHMQPRSNLRKTPIVLITPRSTIAHLSNTNPIEERKLNEDTEIKDLLSFSTPLRQRAM